MKAFLAQVANSQSCCTTGDANDVLQGMISSQGSMLHAAGIPGEVSVMYSLCLTSSVSKRIDQESRGSQYRSSCVQAFMQT